MKFGLLLSSLLGIGDDPIGMNSALTTSNVPQQFLEDAYLVDRVPLMALQIDPRISYAIHVPRTHYNPNVTDDSTAVAKLPLLVYIHGTGREFSAINDFAPFANSTPCAVLTPLFPAGIEGPNDVDSFKELRSKTFRSDLGLLAILDEVAYRWPGIETDKVYMMGYSGGGQFAHRFLYMYPERLAAISIGAPGRTTPLDDQQDWPLGVKDVETLFNRTVQTDLISKIDIQLVVGSEDVEIHGGKDFWEWLQETTGGGGLPPMEQTRLETTKELQQAWGQVGIDAQLDIVPGLAHDAKGARETMLGFLQPLIR